MLRARAVTLLALGAVTAVGCGLSDVFSSAGLKSVVIAYQGDTLVAPGTTIPFAAGAVLCQLRHARFRSPGIHRRPSPGSR